MIVRVFSYTLQSDANAFNALVTEHGFSALGVRPGLVFAYAASSRTDASRGVVVTGWESFADLEAVVGPGLNRPTFLPQALEFLGGREWSHWEGLDLPAVGGGGEARILRLLYGNIDARQESAYFAWVREGVWPRLAATPGLVGSWVGRQVAGSTEPLLAVSAWASEEAITAAAGASVVPLFSPPAVDMATVTRIELFDVFDQVPDARHRSTEGEAVV